MHLRGNQRKVSQLREILNSDVKVIFTSIKPQIVRGVLKYGRNSFNETQFHFTPISVRDTIANGGSQDKNEGYYVTRDEKKLPALRLYKREITIEEELDDEEGLPILTITPKLSPSGHFPLRGTEQGFHPAYAEVYYPGGK